MLTYWASPLLLLSLLLLRAAGTHAEQPEPRSFSVDSTQQPSQLFEEEAHHFDVEHEVHEDGYPEMDGGVRRYECPAGFFRLRRNCYYLSGGVASWREAHFQCMARNASLAVLNRKGKDKILRKYLMGDQFRKLERWIGGIYNWHQMSWLWGLSSDKVLFNSFDNPNSMISDKYIHHCIVLDPTQQYKWNARMCFESKYYICEVAAGRIGKSRRRKNINDPLAPQNQRLRPSKNKDEHKNKMERRRKNKLRSMRKKNWHQQDDNQIWAHGIKIGSRHPKGSMRAANKRLRLKGQAPARHGRKYAVDPEPQVAQATPRSVNSFPADGRGKPAADEQQLQSLGNNDELAFPRLGNDFAHEEILLKI